MLGRVVVGRVKECSRKPFEIVEKDFQGNSSTKQCDQIGRFLKVLGNKVPCKSSSII